ncbi:hypothetical protein BDB00DRAFT_471640 [Zychaea mexicana]|uniref:uncharacterized protein n=1 Tax=Zychaea mexicana TaxID=64656 RepID=UPI0022FE4919|nr:uncharacterized protein BDB00DRAFT_471640 [Zychaea mexicana]KAI9491759.1 hypothetical protein BDB00DRAFT_471640 [Zychaea mexicana]
MGWGRQQLSKIAPIISFLRESEERSLNLYPILSLFICLSVDLPDDFFFNKLFRWVGWRLLCLSIIGTLLIETRPPLVRLFVAMVACSATLPRCCQAALINYTRFAKAYVSFGENLLIYRFIHTFTTTALTFLPKTSLTHSLTPDLVLLLAFFSILQ